MALGFEVSAFLVGFTPLALAAADIWAFLRAALFLCITAFLEAISIALMAACSALAISEDLPLSRALVKDFRASRRVRLVRVLRVVALAAILTRFLADLIIGIKTN